MTIETNTQNRKMLAYEIGRLIGEPVKYQGMPSMAYRVGPYTVDKEGNLTGEDFGPIHSFLVENGYIQELDTPEDETPETADIDVGDDLGDDVGDHVAETDARDLLTITVGAANLTVHPLKNLVFMLYSKQYLIRKMTGGGPLNVPEVLVRRLQEYTPESPEEFSEMLFDARTVAELDGFDYRDGKFSMTYAVTSKDPSIGRVYADLTARILKAAELATRIHPELQEPENEKYFARAWLIRLGFSGPAMKGQRTLLLKPLKGISAFPDDAAALKHREKYAVIRQAKKMTPTLEVTTDDR